MCTRGPIDAVAGPPKPGDENDETHKGPCLARQLSVFRNRRLVNFVDCASRLGWCAKRTRGYILVGGERPYVQWRAVCVTCTWICSRGYKRSREGRVTQVSDVREACSQDHSVRLGTEGA
jgi:hypothetical protein